MTNVLWSGAGLLALSGLVIWLTHQGLSSKRQALSLGAGVALLTFITLGMIQSLGFPRPIDFTSFDEDPVIISYVLDEPNAIYLWVEIAGSSIPRSIVLPWEDGMARELHNAAQASRGTGGTLTMIGDGDGAEGPMFHAQPIPPSPPKTGS